MSARIDHPRRGVWVPVLAAGISYAITRVAFAVLGFRFSLFERPIDVSRLLLDFGAWILVFAIAMWIINKSVRRGSKRLSV